MEAAGREADFGMFGGDVGAVGVECGGEGCAEGEPETAWGDWLMGVWFGGGVWRYTVGDENDE